MKYILTAILLTISTVASGSYADHIGTKVICQGGYKFLIVWVDSGTRRSPSVVQIFKKAKHGENYPPQPVECNEHK